MEYLPVGAGEFHHELPPEYSEVDPARDTQQSYSGIPYISQSSNPQGRRAPVSLRFRAYSKPFAVSFTVRSCELTALRSQMLE
ncbi:hypothetical protein ASPCADRAFT_505633 [Aspergillus carbonarius ITEM 5010]|uniref:Uncharacterized protein n=1 Tax=Aspergillus carbonarius (strain ITEM 5010) TaxID=602072 RepID=A0A1R3RRW2_ASPC5|nr:hypothetical protein ASPCADRAFT_505633 [Aspergillus carbonarius ITEM 5010]